MSDDKPHWGAKDSNSEECIEIDLLFRYLEKDTDEEETARVREHLNQCDICLGTVASMVHNEEHPVTEAEKAEVRKLLKLTPEEQVEKILSYQEEAAKKPEKTELPDRKKKIFDPGSVYWRYAAVAAILIVIVIWGIRYYQVGFQIRQAENLLEENHHIFIEDVRLSGDYATTGISKTMSDEAETSYLDKAASRLEEALQHDRESTKARRLLAQIAIIERDFDKANSLLSDINKNNQTPASILNDLGVLAYQQKNWEMAANRFRSAIKADPKLLEARFNLALTKMRQGREQEAKSILDRYIELETDDAWKRAAMRLRQKIQ